MMLSAIPATVPVAVRHIDPDDVDEEYRRRGLAEVADATLVDAVAEVLGEPRADAPDSFVLHAPLELLARAALLPRVSPAGREAARIRIVGIAARFEAFGAAIDGGDGGDGRPATPPDALERLDSALRIGDLEGAFAAGRHLGAALDADTLTAAVADSLAPSLGAAAHAPIFLHHLPRAAPASSLRGAMFGTLAREVARHPDWRLRWFEGRERLDDRDLVRSLAATPVLGLPGSAFIHPLMTQAETSGLALEVVGGEWGDAGDLALATRSILRVATASMLLDDPDHAAYGWSHCLTIPQGLLTAARSARRPGRLVAIAATHVVGFRAGAGSAPLDTLDGPGGRIGDDGLLPRLDPPTAVELQSAIDHAAGHEDAHLAKYVVSCLDAARADPGGATQHLRAALHLSDRWITGD